MGVRLADDEARASRRRGRIDALVSRLPVIEFGKEIAERWADLFAALSRRGKLIPANDLAVAATALHAFSTARPRSSSAWRFYGNRGDALFFYQSQRGAAPVIFGEPGDASLLGAVSLESPGFVLDAIRRDLVPLPMVIAGTLRS